MAASLRGTAPRTAPGPYAGGMSLAPARLRGLAASDPVAVVLLVAANLVPLVGVLLLGWDVLTLVAAYWLENGVVGLFAALRIATARGPETFRPSPGDTAAMPAAFVRRAEALEGALVPLMRLVRVPFFLFHYGMFWAVHGVFVVQALPGLLGTAAPELASGGLVASTLALVLSHGASFVRNWLGRREYATATPTAEMAAPYGRVVVLHLTILLGAWAVIMLGSPAWALVVMVALKLGVDLRAHLADRRRAAVRTLPGTAPAA